MRDAKHTPGPWRMDYPNGWGGVFIETYRADNSVLIASIYECDNVFPPDDDQREANARLIAAAPELLEALKSVTEIMDMALRMDFLPPSADGPAAQARAAIAKATSESPADLRMREEEGKA